MRCHLCGRTADDSSEDAALTLLTWTHAVENGHERHFCDTCSRANLRAMEGKLDSAWW